VFRFDGAPADSAALAAMIGAIAYRGPDGIGRWVEGPAAIGHLMLHTTAESLEEIQPLANEDGSLVLVMDGWLANYEELRNDLLARGAVLRSRSDAELVLRAYETWRDDCPRHIDGEYAFVVWDARRREAFCARDHAGLRPLHYHWDGKRLLVASDLAGVLAAGDFEQRPNKGKIAEHLSGEHYSAEETLWVGVVRLLPAHAMRAGAAGLRIARHWFPPLEVSVRYPRDEDYQAHYRDLLYDCVRRASRTHRPLACEVSGGHDSSAIFAIAHRLAEQGRLLAPDLKGYTLDFGPDADPLLDELDYARDVGRHLGRSVREVPPYLPEIGWFAEQAGLNRDLPPFPNAATGQTLGRGFLEDGCRVALNGEGGDEFLSAYPFNYYEHLTEFDIPTLLASLSEDLKAFGPWATAGIVYRYGVGPLAPEWLKSLRRKARAGSTRRKPNRRHLTGEMAALLDLRAATLAASPAVAVRNPGKRSLIMRMVTGFGPFGHDFLARDCARLGYELRSPLYDRRFIEFALSIPERQRRRGDSYKVLHLSALSDELPQSVLERRSKAIFNSPFTVALDRARTPVIDQMLRCKIDWLDASGFEDLLNVFDRQPVSSKPVYEVWSAVGCMLLFGPAIDGARTVSRLSS
jgi:asparagine synthase (glutamine-hydrolysing)